MITIHTNPTINRPQLARLFADGFIDDPVWTAIMPTRRLRRHLIQAEINAGLRHVGTSRALDVAYLDDRVAGALLLTPPEDDAEPQPGIIERAMASVEQFVPALRRGIKHQEAVDQYQPEEPHWYLTDIVVSPDMQGRGVGSALLEHRLGLVGDDPIFLEATTAGSARLYQRHGFHPLATVSVLPRTESVVMLRKS